MRFYFLLLLVAAPVAVLGQEGWVVRSLGMDRYSLQFGAAEPITYTANTSTILSNIGGGYAFWYGGETRNVTDAQRTAKPAGTDSVIEVSTGIFQASVSTVRPAVIYYGGSGQSAFICNLTIFDAFVCLSGGTPVAYFSAIGMENPDLVSEMQLPISFQLVSSHPQAGALRQSFLNLAFYRAQMLRQMWDDGQDAVNNNKDRIEKSKVWGGGIMFLIAFAMEAVLVVTTMMHAWMFVVNRFSKATNFIIWLFVFFVIQQIVSILGGFPGWFAMFVVLILYCLILAAVYACVRSKQKKVEAENGGSKSADNGAEARVVPITGADLEMGGDGIKGGATGRGSARWTGRPDMMGSSQKKIMLVLSFLVVLLLVACLIAFYVWKPLDYLIWNRVTNSAENEFAPDTVGKSTLLMYMYPRMATLMQFNTFCIYSTKFCGYWFNRTLTTDDEKKASIFDSFIDLYGINMNEYARTSYKDYVTVNDWFTRALAPGARPIATLNDNFVAVSPADCRMMVFEDISADLHVWLKNEEFTPHTLLNVPPAQAAVFVGGTMVVARLAPADYHRFHSPVAAGVTDWQKVESTIFSVNADAARSGNRVYYNTRLTTILDSPEFGKVGYIAIGATCVGSVIVNVQNQNLAKGDEIGIMQFGGSTVVLLFEKGRLMLDPDLLINSRRGLETLVQMGVRIGKGRP